MNKKLLRDNGRCNAAKKKLVHVPAVSYKFISLVQARQVRSAIDFSHRHNRVVFGGVIYRKVFCEFGALIIFWRGCDKVSRHSLIIRSTSILDRYLYLS